MQLGDIGFYRTPLTLRYAEKVDMVLRSPGGYLRPLWSGRQGPHGCWQNAAQPDEVSACDVGFDEQGELTIPVVREFGEAHGLYSPV